MNEHDRRQGPPGRRGGDELSPQRLEDLILDVKAELEEVREDLAQHRLTTAQFVERMPSSYVTRKEHDDHSASTLLRISVLAAVASPLVTVLVNIAFNHH